ncbi:hypothetical protein TWF569_008899 [Orbilia oligospora]|uniref:Uncharacterized protein n=1 Tax=Orbilia oligospora TaxID=2813651 RepID=A0A7C8NVF1_ORBOL|nr:hypothetical protein TWF706_010616 [Orbilia oligospora]KAF3139873.1 hypothetical protein TWF703_003451 [Orbilia oligospora]KAF3143130.1 hypothetical protein TWF594_005199 [Orbilia oligospora]KAF3155531.1 hypothetical protein TWF569_008899 [Orbilia oligospora]
MPHSSQLSLPNILPPTPSNHIQTWLARKLDRPIPQFEAHALDDNRRKNFVPKNRDMHLDLAFSVTNYTVKNLMVKIKERQ